MNKQDMAERMAGLKTNEQLSPWTELSGEVKMITVDAPLRKLVILRPADVESEPGKSLISTAEGVKYDFEGGNLQIKESGATSFEVRDMTEPGTIEIKKRKKGGGNNVRVVIGGVKNANISVSGGDMMVKRDGEVVGDIKVDKGVAVVVLPDPAQGVRTLFAFSLVESLVVPEELIKEQQLFVMNSHRVRAYSLNGEKLKL